MRFAAFILALLVLIPAGARAEDPQEKLLDEVSSLRLTVERQDDLARDLERERTKLSGQLDELASQIRARKAARPQNDLLPDLTLQALLQKSQELSEAFALVHRELEALEKTRAQRLVRLGTLYDQLIGRTAEALRKAGPTARTAAAQELTRFRAERGRLRAELAAKSPRHSPLETGDMLASNDPDELREQADAVSDEQTRLRRRVASLDRHLAELDLDLRLDRELRDFVEDRSLFGEESRTVRLTRPAAADVSGGKDSNSDGSYSDPGTGECSGGACGTPNESGGGGLTKEGQASLGLEDSAGFAENLSPAQQLTAFRAERERLVEQLKRLQILHDRLEEKAEQLSNQ
jgi:hypothetical protein